MALLAAGLDPLLLPPASPHHTPLSRTNHAHPPTPHRHRASPAPSGRLLFVLRHAVEPKKGRARPQSGYYPPLPNQSAQVAVDVGRCCYLQPLLRPSISAALAPTTRRRPSEITPATSLPTTGRALCLDHARIRERRISRLSTPHHPGLQRRHPQRQGLWRRPATSRACQDRHGEQAVDERD